MQYRFTKRVFRLLKEEGLDPYDVSPEQIVNRYRSGDCWDFAVALYGVTGWPIVLAQDEDGTLYHALNVHPSKRLVDASGFITVKQVHQYYPVRAVRLVPVTPREALEAGGLLLDCSPSRCYSVRQALRWLRTMRHPPFDELFPPAETFD